MKPRTTSGIVVDVSAKIETQNLLIKIDMNFERYGGGLF
jgi:hypothetical protein